jgi:hypothetical protein
VPIIASAFFGAGIYIVILSVLSYVIDAYQSYSASALAGVILVRNIVGAGFPLFASQMYARLGNEWASTLLAFLSLLFVPIPIWWFYKGESLRLKSPFARYVTHFSSWYRVRSVMLTTGLGNTSIRMMMRRIDRHDGLMYRQHHLMVISCTYDYSGITSNATPPIALTQRQHAPRS